MAGQYDNEHMISSTGNNPMTISLTALNSALKLMPPESGIRKQLLRISETISEFQMRMKPRNLEVHRVQF